MINEFSNLSFNLKEEKIIIEADVEVLNNNNTEDNGFNITFGVRKDRDLINQNNFTYHFFRDRDTKDLYLKTSNTHSSNDTRPYTLKKDNDKVIKSLKVRIIAKLELINGYVNCEMIIKDNTGEYIFSKTLVGGGYQENYRLFLNIGQIGNYEFEGTGIYEGLKLHSLKVESIK